MLIVEAELHRRSTCTTRYAERAMLFFIVRLRAKYDDDDDDEDDSYSAITCRN